MRVLLVALSVPDPAALRAALGAALGATAVDLCQATEAAVTWLENRPCDLIAISGRGAQVAESVARVRRVSRAMPLLVVVPDPSAPEAGAAWLQGADDVITAQALVAGTIPEGLDDVRHPERDAARRIQRLWLAGTADGMRQQLTSRLGTRCREVGLSAEGLAGLTTQDLETPQSAALVVHAVADPETLVLGVRRVKRTYPGLAVTVVAECVHHDAFRRAGADECVGAPGDADAVLHAVVRTQAACRASAELDAIRARETRLRSLLEHLPEAVMLVSPEHAVLAVNLAALRLIGAQDARQVLGAPLAPWLEPGDETPDATRAMIDAVAGGATREMLARTRHLADPRRLQLRAVPFQRETGGAPAALMVLRDAPDDSTLDASALVGNAVGDEERTAWNDERTALQARADALDAEATEARARVDALTAEVAEARTRMDALAADVAEAQASGAALQDAQASSEAATNAVSAELQVLRARVEPMDTLGLDAADLPRLVAAARRLVQVEQEEMPTVLARLESQQQAHVTALESLRDATRRVADLEAAASAANARVEELERDARLAATPQGETDAQLTTEPVPAAPTSPPAPAPAVTHVEVPTPHEWILQEIAQVGFVRTTSDGRVLEATARAAALCGQGDADAWMAGGTLPQPMLLVAPDEALDLVRFEVCIQTDDGTARWIAGVRFPTERGADGVTWWLADASSQRGVSQSDTNRRETLDAVLDVVAAECTAIVEAAPVARGPRALDAPAVAPAAAQALDRARMLLAQAASFRRRQESHTALDELRGHLTTLEPVLRRLATDDVTWQLSLPDEDVHVSAAPTDLERCVTGLVSAVRDVLPLGGRLSLAVQTPAPAGVDQSAIRRLDACLVLDAQGFGLGDLAVPAMLADLASRFGGVVEVSRVDPLTQRLTLRVPRAFVIAHAA